MEGECAKCGSEFVSTNGARQRYCSRSCYYASLKGRGKPHRPVVDKLAENIAICEETECWIWVGSRLRGGYGSVRVEGRTRAAHRVSFEVYRGPISAGLDVLHRCDTPACVNPHHLFLGTDADNSNDKLSKGREARLKGAANGNAKLSESDVIAIRDSVGAPISELAEKYNTSKSQVGKIRSGRSWSYLLVVGARR